RVRNVEWGTPLRPMRGGVGGARGEQHGRADDPAGAHEKHHSAPARVAAFLRRLATPAHVCRLTVSPDTRGRLGGGYHTFPAPGFPSRPVGRTRSTPMRTAKTSTSCSPE